LLTGDTSEQKVYFLRRPSATGKGTFAYVVSEIMRDYAVAGDDQMLAYNSRSNVPEALASARGARLFLFDELPFRFRLNDALLKRLSGESRVTARALHGHSFDYLPTYKVFLLSNYDPNIPPDNDAIKRRLIVIPFDHKTKAIDTTLRAKLREEFPQILGWMIEGAVGAAMVFRSRNAGAGTPCVLFARSNKHRTNMGDENDRIRIAKNCSDRILRERSG